MNDGQEDIYVGDANDLMDAWLATDLEVLSFGDDGYWPGQLRGDLNLQFEYDPLGTWVIAEVRIVQRLPL